MFNPKVTTDFKGRSDLQLTFQDGKVFWIKLKPSDIQVLFVDDYKLDGTKSPKHIDTVSEGEKPNLGIYKLQGDELIICSSNTSGMERPKDFRTDQGPQGVRILYLKRISQPPKDK